MKVAVLGGGLAGCCVALALANRRVRVDLIERAPALMGAASLQNEGKLHLGYVYAADPDSRTHKLMALGSLCFLPILKGLAGIDPRVVRRSVPFVYGVPTDSQLTIESIRGHFERVDQAVARLLSQDPQAMLAAGWRPSRQMSEREFSESFDTSAIQSAIETQEYSVDTAQLADLVSTAVRRHPMIDICSSTSVESAEMTAGETYLVTLREGQEVRKRLYPVVVNCLWSDRLRIDASVGLASPQPWLMRYKAAITLRRGKSRWSPLPSATFILGPYGDMVNYDSGKMYLSWYPTCKLGESKSLDCASLLASAATIDHADVVRDSIRGLSQFLPAVRDFIKLSESIEVGGGIIFALGQTDITDPKSGLHQRFQIGPSRHGRWISLDTGKYCMAPYYGEQVAGMVCDLLEVPGENTFMPHSAL